MTPQEHSSVNKKYREIVDVGFFMFRLGLFFICTSKFLSVDLYNGSVTTKLYFQLS